MRDVAGLLVSLILILFLLIWTVRILRRPRTVRSDPNADLNTLQQALIDGKITQDQFQKMLERFQERRYAQSATSRGFDVTKNPQPEVNSAEGSSSNENQG